MKPRSARGTVVLLALVMMLNAGVMLLLDWQRALQEWLRLIHDRQSYLRAWHQAESALAWGLVQSWPRQQGGCQQSPCGRLQACLLYDATTAGWLLRAGAVPANRATPLWLYRRVERVPMASHGDVSRVCLRACAHGWHDFSSQ